MISRGAREPAQRRRIAWQADDARAVRQLATRPVVLFQRLDRFQPLEEPDHLAEQLLRLTQARRNEQNQPRIVNRRMQRKNSSGRALSALPRAVQEQPGRRRAQQLRLPRVRVKAEPILGETRPRRARAPGRAPGQAAACGASISFGSPPASRPPRARRRSGTAPPPRPEPRDTATARAADRRAAA